MNRWRHGRPHRHASLRSVAPASGGTFVAVQDSTPANVSITFASSKYIALNAIQQAQFKGVRFLKCVAGGNETGDKIITLFSKPN